MSDETISLERVPEKRWPRTLVAMVEVLTDHWQRTGRSDAQANADATDAVRVLAKHLGGINIYLPTGEALDLALRDQAIYAEFNGQNHLFLARKHDLTKRQIERIIAEQRALHVAQIQGRLFDAPR